MEFERFSPACERNKDAIWSVMANAFAQATRILEVGSGSGQHAFAFSARLIAEKAPEPISWQPTELPSSLPSLSSNLARAKAPCRPAVILDVAQPYSNSGLPEQYYDGFFTANTLHIMSLAHVHSLFTLLGEALKPGANAVIYGPFKYQGGYTSDSNAEFDQWLKARDPRSGIRDIEQVCELAQAVGLELEQDHPMPANNQCLHFVKAR
ncbi:MAG: DUF938 domain-containing protein [Pontibacterium sp.]